MTITLDGTTGITAPTYGGSVTAEYSVPVTNFKNRIINGAMVIDQRNAGASVTINTTALVYTIDRWSMYGKASAGVYTVQQSSSVVPNNFTSSMKITVTTADATLAAGSQYSFRQRIEGYNIADFGFGTSAAKALTLSFKVRSSVTGTFGGAMFNDTGARCMPFSYTISAADTWTDITVAVPAETAGTWLTTNGDGLEVFFLLGCDTAQKGGTASTWGSSFYLAPSGSVNLISTLNATFYITGVQLEKGSTATSFDYRDYGRELILCQRYFETTYPIGTAVGTASATATAPVAFSMGDSGSVTQQIIWIYKVKKCSAPTVTVYNPSTGASGSAWYSAGSLSVNFSAQGSRVDQATFGSGTAGMAINNTFSYYMTASSEL